MVNGVTDRVENALMLPGIMLLGAFATPFATLVFFYEMNAPRNISFLEINTLAHKGA